MTDEPTNPRMRQVLRLWNAGRTTDQIADALGVSYGTVANWTRRAREQGYRVCEHRREPIFSGPKLTELVSLFNSGMTMAALSERYGVFIGTINNAIQRARREGMNVRTWRRRGFEHCGPRDPERVETVLRLQRSGLTYAQIAERLATSRSAVAGMVHRWRDAA